MTAATAAVQARVFYVGGYQATARINQPVPGCLSHLAIKWSPMMPKRLNKQLMRQYRRGRDKAIADLAAAAGLPRESIVVIEA